MAQTLCCSCCLSSSSAAASLRIAAMKATRVNGAPTPTKRCLRASAESNGRPSELVQNEQSEMPSTSEMGIPDFQQESQSRSSNVWDTKPPWLQPWTILLAGSSLVVGMSLLMQNALATFVFVVLVASWWYAFLYLYPMIYKNSLEEEAELLEDELYQGYK